MFSVLSMVFGGFFKMYFVICEKNGIVAGGYSYNEGVNRLREKRKEEPKKKFHLMRISGKV